jgi:hypothetical protein
VFDPLLDPLLEGDPDEDELNERLAIYDAYMGLFDIELDRVLFKHGFLISGEERTRVKWVVARFMQVLVTSDLDAIEGVFLERFLTREQELRLLDQELDWVVSRHEGAISPEERAEIREAVVERLDANVLLGLADLERVYVTEVVPNRVLDAHLEDLAAFFASRLPPPDGAWDDFACWSESSLSRIADAHTESTVVRALRLQAMHFPRGQVASLLEWARRPGVVLHGAAGLRQVFSVRSGGSRRDVVESFRVLDRFWKIMLIRAGGPDHEYWRDVLKESSRL